MKISTVNLYTATTSLIVNDQFLKTVADGTYGLGAGRSFFSIRKWTFTLDGEQFEGYRFWLVTNPTSSTVTLDVSASADAPAYFLSYDDASLNFNTCIGLLDEDDFLIQVFGGQGGTGANSRHETWVFLPKSEYDLSPLLKSIDRVN